MKFLLNFRENENFCLVSIFWVFLTINVFRISRGYGLEKRNVWCLFCIWFFDRYSVYVWGETTEWFTLIVGKHLGYVSSSGVLAGGKSGRGIDAGIPMGILRTLSVPGLVLVEADRLLSSLGEATVVRRHVLERTMLRRHDIMTQRRPFAVVP